MWICIFLVTFVSLAQVLKDNNISFQSLSVGNNKPILHVDNYTFYKLNKSKKQDWLDKPGNRILVTALVVLALLFFAYTLKLCFDYFQRNERFRSHPTMFYVNCNNSNDQETNIHLNLNPDRNQPPSLTPTLASEELSSMIHEQSNWPSSTSNISKDNIWKVDNVFLQHLKSHHISLSSTTPLGSGCSGVVMSGRFYHKLEVCKYHITKAQPVAIKVVFPINKKNRVQFKNESLILSKLVNHENIIRIIDSIDNSKFLYLIIERASKGTLGRYCKGKQISEIFVKSWIDELVSAVEYIHDKQIYHRDIKSGNQNNTFLRL